MLPKFEMITNFIQDSKEKEIHENDAKSDENIAANQNLDEYKVIDSKIEANLIFKEQNPSKRFNIFRNDALSAFFGHKYLLPKVEVSATKNFQIATVVKDVDPIHFDFSSYVVKIQTYS